MKTQQRKQLLDKVEKVSRWTGEAMKRRMGETEIGGNGERECRSKGVKENYPDTPIPRYPDTPIRYKAGFSLIEIMVVVVIIAITIGGALFYGQGTYRRTSVKNAARDVASLMRMASSKALSERIYYNVVLSSGGCYLEKHYSGNTDGIWENIPASSADETDDNYFVIDSSPGARKKLANVVDIDNGTGTSLSLRKIAFTLKETVMGITADDVMSNATWTPSDVYSIYLDDDDSGIGKVKYLITVDSDTARVKIYSSW